MVDKQRLRSLLASPAGRRVVRHVPAVLVLIAMAVLLGMTASRRPPTVDEHYHTTRGIAFWAEADTRLSSLHPPLGNALAALPAAVALEPIDFDEFEGWRNGNRIRTSSDFFSSDYERARSVLMWSRGGQAALAVLFAAYFYAFLCSFFGVTAAISGLVLLAFNPTLLAQAGIVTTDFPASVGTFVMVGELARYLRSSRRLNLVGFGIAAGAAMMTKYTLFGVFGLVLSCWLGWVLLQRTPPGQSRFRKWGRLSVDVAIVGLLVLFVFNLCYLFENTGWRAPHVLSELGPPPSDRMGLVHKGLEVLPGWLPVPLPYTFLRGLASVSAHIERGHISYFMGEVGSRGWLSYFPVMVAIKTPSPVLVLLVAGFVASLIARRRPSMALGLLIATSAGFLAMILPSRLNIGVRHALPLIPLLTALAGVSASVLIDRLRQSSSELTFALPALSLLGMPLMPLIAITEFQDYFGYFNAFVGRERGHRISIIGEDVGQDAGRLALLAKREKLFPLYYGSVVRTSPLELARRGVKVKELDCGTEIKRRSYAAVHMGQLLRRPNCYDFIKWAELRHEINDHIRVYYVDPAKAPRQPKRTRRPRPRATWTDDRED